MGSLGLLMQLCGTVGVVMAALIAIPAAAHERSVGGVAFFIAILCGVRAGFHRAAGGAALYSTTDRGERAIATYLWVAGCHSALTLALLQRSLAPATLAQLAALLLTWPALLGCYLALRRARPRDTDSDPDQHSAPGPSASIDNAAALATLLGVLGVAVASVVLAISALLDPNGPLWRQVLTAAQHQPGASLLVRPAGLGIGFALLARAVIHLRFGRRLAALPAQHRLATIDRYYRLSTFTAVAAAVPTGAFVFLLSARPAVAVISGVGVLFALQVWPHLLQRLYAEHRFHQLLRRDAADADADDNGDTAAPLGFAAPLGWITLAAGGAIVGQWLAGIPSALVLAEATPWPHLEALSGAGGAILQGGLPWSLLLAGLLWLGAGVGLLRGDRRALPVAKLGAVAVVITALSWTLGLAPALWAPTTPLALVGALLFAVGLALSVYLLSLVPQRAQPLAVATLHRR